MKRARNFILLFSILILLSYAVLNKESCLIREAKVLEKMTGDCSKEEIRKLLKEYREFPVAQEGKMCYENSYGDNRSYGGKRKHEGIDIIPQKVKDDYYKVVAASDGIVEKIGWLTLGGYRIGISSDQRFYYYYAHLARYAPGIKKGKRVKAGELLGYMGNTGYGKEGTKGKFIVHLHFGIYRQVHGEEKSLNPYFLLCYMQK